MYKRAPRAVEQQFYKMRGQNNSIKKDDTKSKAVVSSREVTFNIKSIRIDNNKLIVKI